MKNSKNVALFYPWFHLYGGGELFAEYTANKLSEKYTIDLYFYKKKNKIHPKINLSKKIKLISIKSKNPLIDYLCSHVMLFAQTYLIFFFNSRINKHYRFAYSLGGEFFSNIKTYQYLHICIYSLNIFEYKNFGISNLFKKILRFLVVLICRIYLGINRKKFFNVTTFSNSFWSLKQAKKTYELKKHKVFYPCFKIPNLNIENFIKFKKRKNDFVILGRVSQDKNIVDGIKVFFELKKTIPDAKLHVIGPIDKIYMKKIKNRFDLNKSIKFYGLIKMKIRDKILRNCKYGLNFFYSEHFGRNILEMQKCGIIAFARNKGGVKELLFNKHQKYNNYVDLIKKINKVNNNDLLKKKLFLINHKVLKKRLSSSDYDQELFQSLI